MSKNVCENTGTWWNSDKMEMKNDKKGRLYNGECLYSGGIKTDRFDNFPKGNGGLKWW